MMRYRKSWPVLLALIGIGVLGASPPAQAQFLDMTIQPPHATGSVTFLGGLGTPLVGTNIEVDSIVGVGLTGSAGPGPFTITGGLLNFTTGGFTGTTGPAGAGGLWNFAGGGTITVTGTIGAPIGAAGVLLSGAFTSATVVNTGTTILVNVGIFLDTKHPAIEAYYADGVNVVPGATTWDGVLNLSFEIPAAVATGSAFASSNIGSGDIINNPTVIPEPTSIALLGMGAVSLAGYSWRRIKARRAAA